jgi:hypothetical protein
VPDQSHPELKASVRSRAPTLQPLPGSEIGPLTATQLARISPAHRPAEEPSWQRLAAENDAEIARLNTDLAHSRSQVTSMSSQMNEMNAALLNRGNLRGEDHGEDMEEAAVKAESTPSEI